jgi:tetratricopeptide (TPR) repeat protein
MKNAVNCASVVVAGLLLLSAAVFASGGGPFPKVEHKQLSTAEKAEQLYNEGVGERDKATKIEKEAAAEPDAAKRARLLDKARERHESSIGKFVEATKKNARLHQAWGNLGYAYRKTGNYDASLAAYAKALEIEPNYTPAIEYRAEAYLALNQFELVESAYMVLFKLDRPRADELTAAIDKWLGERKADPGSADRSKVEEFSKWVASRKQLAAQTSMLVVPRREW